MTPDRDRNEQQPAVRLSRRQKPGTGNKFRRPFAPFEWLQSSLGAWRFPGGDFLAPARKPGMFLLAALLCVLLTFLVKITRDATEARPAAGVAQAAAEEVDAVPAAQAEPINAADATRPPDPAPKAAPRKPPQEEPKNVPRTVPLAELEALTDVEKKRARVPADPPQPESSPDPPIAVPPVRMKPVLPAGPLAIRGNIHKSLARALNGWPIQDGLTDFNEAEFTRDAQTGILFSKDHRWHVTKRYRLPIDDRAIDRARVLLMRTMPVIELQWWFPRVIEIPEEHFKGKVAKLRFLAALNDVDSQIAEGSVHVLRTRGTNPGGISVVEADALFYLPHLPAPLIPHARIRVPRIGSFPEMWAFVPASVTEKPTWFLDGKNSIARGDVGRLPVAGGEIEALRKAVRESEENGRIREVKFWPSRVEATTRHRLSKLRYEVVTDRDISLEEAVFDHKKGALAYIPLADDVFPEEDKHATSLDRLAK
jgi:hypothetical protein